MSGYIPQAFIDDLLARVDIVDVIDSYVPLRKAGRNHKARCPFHDEKTPSFSVNQEKQFYHCFGCGASGTAITFLMEYNHLSFVDAIENLANRAGLQVPREGDQQKKDSELSEIYELMELVTKFYRKQLKEHPQANRATDYLKRRGITGELAVQFELGYAPAGWDNLINALGNSGDAKKRLAKSGMLIARGGGGYYDRFRDRIIFPIRDQRGRTIGFGGRVLDDGSPKYLNNPETPVFHKGRELYGLYQARKASKNMERIYIVEGYMDVLALVQHGIINTAATLGTAATSHHLERIFRVTSEIVFCFDGDAAGRKAAWRALETALPMLRDGRQVFFMFMPEGMDPDDLVRQNGKSAFEDISNYKSLTDYLLQEHTGNFNPGIREHKSKLIHDISVHLKRLPHGSLKQMMIDEVATLTETDPAMIRELLTAEPVKSESRRITGKIITNTERSLMTQTVQLLLKSPKLALDIESVKDITDIGLPGTDFLADLIKLIQQTPDITLARLIENWRGTKYEKRLSELAIVAESPYEKDEAYFDSAEYLESEFRDALDRLRELSRKKNLEKLAAITKLDELSDEQMAMLRSLNPAARTPSEN